MTGPLTRLLHGLRVSAAGNAHAFGYSIGITSTYGVVSVAHPHPSGLEILGFALAGVLQFSLLNLAVAFLLRDRDRAPETQKLMLVATATDLLAVAGMVGAAIGVTALLPSPLVWPVAPFLAGLVYVAVQSIEFATARQTEEEG